MQTKGEEKMSEEDVERLRDKLQLIQGDRKAYFETYEQTKTRNEDTIKDVRERNERLRKDIAKLKSASGNVSEDRSIEKENVRLTKLRGAYDALHNQMRAESNQLQHLQNEFHLLSVETSDDADPTARHIRQLENRLDKAMIKYNEAQSIRKTYRQITKRLQDERVGFNNQIAGVEETVDAKDGDFKELSLLASDAEQARDVAVQQRKVVKSRLHKDRTQREKDLLDAQNALSQQEALTEEARKRRAHRAEMIAKSKGDLGKAEEERLKTTLSSKTLHHNQMDEEMHRAREMLAEFEEAFTRIKEATGVADVNEVIQKIVSQEDTQQNLRDLTEENTKRIEMLSKTRQELQRHVEDLKYSSGAGAAASGSSRARMDRLETELSDATANLKRCKAKYEKANLSAVEAKAGVNHLHAKLKQYPPHAADEVDEGRPLDVLERCEVSLHQILSELRSQGGEEKEGGAAARVLNISESELQSQLPFNRRVMLPSEREASKRSRREDAFEFGVAGEAEASREQVKRASQALVDHRTRSHRRRKTRGGKKGGAAPRG